MEEDDEDVVSRLERRAYLTATSCFAWLAGGELVTGQMGGQLVTYRQEAGGWRVAAVQATDLGAVICVQAVQLGGGEVLVAGGQDGRVQCFGPAAAEGGYPVLGWSWPEADHLALSSVAAGKLEGGGRHLVLAKGSFCIVLPVTPEGLAAGEPRVLSCGPGGVAGLELRGGGLLVAGQEGPVREWRLDRGEATIGLEGEGQHYRTYGMAASPSQAIFVTLQAIDTFNDHLIMREPARLVFWTLESASSLEQAVLEAAPTPGPDLLEALRVVRAAGRPELEFGSSADPARCRLDWWLGSGLARRGKAEDGCAAEAVQRCETVLRCQAAAGTLREPGAGAEARAAAASFLRAFSSEPAEENSEPGFWQCRLCPADSPSPDSATVSSVVCLRGHSWPRCLLTQRPVMVARPLACRWCSASALPHPAPDLPQPANAPPRSADRPCPLCGGPLRPAP
jgi:hypothetical protein